MGAPRFDGAQLALELHVVPPATLVELARFERLANRAVGLARVGAVVEAALRGELRDVGEGAVEVALPDLQLTQARRVDEDRAARA